VVEASVVVIGDGTHQDLRVRCENQQRRKKEKKGLKPS